MFAMSVDWSALNSHPIMRARRLALLPEAAPRAAMVFPPIHRWVKTLERGAAQGFARFNPEPSPVNVLRQHHVDVRWNAPDVTPQPVETRGRHVNVSITREAKRADERRATLRAGQRAPEAARGKVCVEVGRIPGRVPPSAMALPGAPYKGGSTISDGEGLACSLEHDAAWSALCEANAHHADMSAELTFAEDGAAIGTSTAAMVRGAQARLKSAMARLQRAQARYDGAVDAWVALSQVRAEDARDADARALSRELKRQPVRSSPDKGVSPKGTRAHRGKGRPMPTVERR